MTATRALSGGGPAWLAALALCLAGGGSAGCKREQPPAPVASASAKQPEPDPRRFAAAAAGWGERWKDAHLLPDCAPLLEGEGERALCAQARRAVTALQAALARGASHEELAALASTAALAAQRAAQALRKSGVGRLFQERAVSAASGSASPPAIAPRVHAHAHAHALASAPVRTQSSRDLEAIATYARVAALGLRHLAVYLEFGPPPLRSRALEELERVAREEPHWAALRALVDEALLVENGPELKQRLARLRERLGP